MKKAVRGWMNTVDWDTVITLTFANELTKRRAERALARFWQRVDYKLYGNAVQRYNKRCERMNVIEGDGLASNYHFHIVSKRPHDRFATVTAYCDFLREQWLAENRNNYRVKFEPIRDVTDCKIYTTKKIANDNCDTLLVYSSHIAAS